MRTVSWNVRLTLFAGIVALAGMPATAQTGTAARMTVPFAFESGGHRFPAGEYRIRMDSSVFMRLEGTSDSRTIMVQSDDHAKPVAHGSAVFTRIGSHYFLDQVRMPNAGALVTCIKTRRERTEQRDYLVSARLDGAAPVQLALAKSGR